VKIFRNLRLTVLTGGLFFVAASWAETECRIFTDVKGRCVTGRLVDIDAIRGTVTIRRGDQKECCVSMAMFSEADQQYFQKTILAEPIRITATLVDFRTRGVFDKRYQPENIKSLGYNVVLLNRLNSELKNIEVEYCIFYRQEKRMRTKRTATDGILCGGWDIQSLNAGEKRALRSDTVWIYDEPCAVSLFGVGGEGEGEVLGIWLRVSSTVPTGESRSMEFCSPAGLAGRREWTTRTVLAGLNAERAKRYRPSPRSRVPGIGSRILIGSPSSE